jgi:hypothetical protein
MEPEPVRVRKTLSYTPQTGLEHVHGQRIMGEFT